MAFKEVPGYESLYKVSPYGIIISIKGGRFRKLKWVKHFKGYPRVKLSKNGKYKHFEVHRIVALTYLNKTNDHLVINHKDGDKYNNHVSNLEYCTSKENTSHAINLGLVNLAGENNPNAKLTDRDIDIMKKLYERTNLTQKEIGVVFNIQSAHSSEILRGVKRNIEQDKECTHESDGMAYLTDPVKYKCVKCGVFL